MKRRTTIEIDEELLARARQALGCSTMRETVEEALRRAAEGAERADEQRADRQRTYLRGLSDLIDPEVLASEDMWR